MVTTQMTGAGRPSASPVGTANQISMIATPKTASHGMRLIVSRHEGLVSRPAS
jgi:hypothetical protein